MSRLLKTELKRSVCSKYFFFGTALLALFAILSALYYIEDLSGYNPNYLYENCIKNGEYVSDPMFPLASIYLSWVGADRISLAYSLFYNLIPICAAIPFAWSYHSEKKCGYIKNVAIRADKKYYYAAKTIAVFISGFLAVLIPIVINILMVSAFVPHYPTWAGYNLYNVVYFGGLWSDLYYTNPFIHMILYALFASFYGGIYAMLSFSVTFYVNKLIAVMFVPFVLTIVGGYVENAIINATGETISEFVPTLFIHTRSLNAQHDSAAAIIVTVLLVLFIFITVYFKGRKSEIY